MDLINEKFGRLTVIEFSHKAKRNHCYWLCRCVCGQCKVVSQDNLLVGHTKSCGCYRRERGVAQGITNIQHGYFGTPTYKSWTCLKQRCLNPKADQYPYYGGRGIEVCQQWKESFESFLSDMGDRPTGHTIDRINTNGHYEPGNCRWATPKQQAFNRRKRTNATT